MTARVGLIGDPVAHSVSPAFQQAALDALGIDARYEAWRTAESELAERVAMLRADGVLGANVTVPHKQAVIPLLNEIDGTARRAGAVNTIVNRDGRLAGYNTDIPGFLAALHMDAGFDPAGCSVAVLGAGGAARAVAMALAGAGAASVLVLNRSPERAKQLVRELTPEIGSAHALPDDGMLPLETLVGRNLVVNCTTVGMLHSARQHDTPVQPMALPPGALIVDIVANPLVTPLMRAAQERGLRTLGGLSMLVRQGAASFELWTGRSAPLDVMFAAARRAMGVEADE